MKLSNVTAMVGKMMAVGLLAGTVALLIPAKAQAQQFAVGVQFGQRGYDGDRRDFYERERFEREREAVARHEAWEQQQRFVQRARWEGGRGFDRDHDGFDRDHDRERYAERDGRGFREGYNQPRWGDGR